MSIDPLAAKYPGWSPYNYCINNPMGIIDPDGMDWYEQNGVMRYNKDVHSADDFDRLGIHDATYKWSEFNDKTTGTQYNSDGTAFFSNEKLAYTFIWENSFDEKGDVLHEVTAYLTNKGVYVLNSENNDAKTGFFYGSNWYSDKYEFRGQIIRGSIHTHPDNSIEFDQWDYNAGQFGVIFVVNRDDLYAGVNSTAGYGYWNVTKTTNIFNGKFSVLKYIQAPGFSKVKPWR